MGSKGLIPPRRPLPNPSIVHPDPFGPPIRPPAGGFPPFDMLPPEILGQKLAAQHIEMQKLVTENRRLAATHVILRQELASAQHELQMLHVNIGDIKSESEQQNRALIDKIAIMEADLQAANSVKMELEQVQAEARSLIAARPELTSKVQKLDQDLQKSHSDLQQIPMLLSQLDGLQQEYQCYRATYDYEKKLSNDHLESLQVMEKNYLTMAREVEKLRAELTNSSNSDRAGAYYGGNSRFSESDASGNYSAGQIAYGHGYSVSQGKGPFPVDGSCNVAVDTVVGAANSGIAGGATPVGAQSGPESTPAAQRTAYEGARGPNFNAQRGHTGAYDVRREFRGPGYDAQRGTPVIGYDPQRVPGYDSRMWGSYEGQGSTFSGHAAPPYDSHRGPGYDVQIGSVDPSSKPPGSQGQEATAKNASYGSAVAPAHGAGAGYGPRPQGGNAAKR